MSNTKQEIVARLLEKAPLHPPPPFQAFYAWNRACIVFAEALAENAKVLYGVVDINGECVTSRNISSDTHTCIALDFRPIDDTPTLQEVIRLLRTNDNLNSKRLSDMADRLAKKGIKP